MRDERRHAGQPGAGESSPVGPRAQGEARRPSSGGGDGRRAPEPARLKSRRPEVHRASYRKSRDAMRLGTRPPSRGVGRRRETARPRAGAAFSHGQRPHSPLIRRCAPPSPTRGEGAPTAGAAALSPSPLVGEGARRAGEGAIPGRVQGPASRWAGACLRRRSPLPPKTLPATMFFGGAVQGASGPWRTSQTEQNGNGRSVWKIRTAE